MTKCRAARADRDLLIERYTQMARSLAQRFHHWSLDEDDFTQIALLAMIRAIDGHHPKLGSLTAHVWNRISYALGETIVATKRQTRSSGILGFDCADPNSDQDIDDDACHELRAAIGQLPNQDREILISLYGLGDKPPMEREAVAAHVGSNRANVTESKQRSLATLRTQLSA